MAWILLNDFFLEPKLLEIVRNVVKVDGRSLPTSIDDSLDSDLSVCFFVTFSCQSIFLLLGKLFFIILFGASYDWIHSISASLQLVDLWNDNFIEVHRSVYIFLFICCNPVRYIFLTTDWLENSAFKQKFVLIFRRRIKHQVFCNLELRADAIDEQQLRWLVAKKNTFFLGVLQDQEAFTHAIQEHVGILNSIFQLHLQWTNVYD